MTSTPAPGLPVVPLFTVPWTVAARPAFANIKIPAKSAATHDRRFIALLVRHPYAAHADASLRHRSLGRSLPMPWPLRSPDYFSSLRNRPRNTFPHDIRTADPVNFHKPSRAAPSVDPAWSDAAPSQMRPVECKK